MLEVQPHQESWEQDGRTVTIRTGPQQIDDDNDLCWAVWIGEGAHPDAWTHIKYCPVDRAREYARAWADEQA